MAYYTSYISCNDYKYFFHIIIDQLYIENELLTCFTFWVQVTVSF